TASTIAAPMCACAPICVAKDPTCSEMTIPKGIEIRTTGTDVTLMRNHICSRNSWSGHGRRSTVCTDSSPIENILPASSTRPTGLNAGRVFTGTLDLLLVPQLLERGDLLVVRTGFGRRFFVLFVA